MPLLRRKIRCHFCNQSSRESVVHIPRTYLCPQCDAVNYFDERGNVADPPTEDMAAAPMTAFQYATSLPRSSSPVMPLEPESLFCNTCQRNQLLLNKTLAEYLPDEDDPEYEKYAASLDAYRNELEDRYPQVCQDCLPQVQDQIRAAGYAAKADNLRRMIDRSREHSRTVHTSRQTWTLRIIALAKCIYICSVVVGLLWHAMGLTMTIEDDVDADTDVEWTTCLAQAFSVRRAAYSCVMSPLSLRLLKTSLIADWSTIWWNPKLASKTNSITGRMRGLKSLWAIRAIVLTLRTAVYLYWNVTRLHSANLSIFHNTNVALLVAMTLSFTLTWKTVRIVYTPVALPEDTYIPSAPNTPQCPKSSYKPAHPQISTFDTMAQGFTSSFQADSSSALPPSPTLTEASTTSHYTEFTTPGRRSVYQDDTMDWTPTTRRFASAAPDILPPQFASHASPSNNPPVSPPGARAHTNNSPISLFSKPDPNPFRHKVPPAPKPPAQSRLDPWKRAPWAPPLKETTPNFFRTERTTRSQSKAAAATNSSLSYPSYAHTNPNVVRDRPLTASTVATQASDWEPDTEREREREWEREQEGDDNKGLQGTGVPRNVRRDAELFASPKLKYDYYGTMRDTGLEETFNGLFSN